MKNKNIYLDNHSSTQIDERVYKQMIPFLTNVFGNPHSDSHSHGWTSNKFIDLSRSKIAKVINANKEEIFFTKQKWPHFEKNDNVAKTIDNNFV